MRKARLLREAKDVSLRQVAEELGCEHASIHKFELGQTMLRESTLLAYARYFGVTVDELIAIVPDDDSERRASDGAGE